VQEVQAALSPEASPASSGDPHWHVGTITNSWPAAQSGISVGLSTRGMPRGLPFGDCIDGVPLHLGCNFAHSGEVGRPWHIDL